MALRIRCQGVGQTLCRRWVTGNAHTQQWLTMGQGEGDGFVAVAGSTRKGRPAVPLTMVAYAAVLPAWTLAYSNSLADNFSSLECHGRCGFQGLCRCARRDYADSERLRLREQGPYVR